MTPVEALEVAALGVAAGVVAGVFGVGGGIIFVPTLTLILGLTQLEAEATSLLGSWRQTRTGEVRWRAAIIMGLVSVVTAIIGALVADAVSEDVLRIGFAILLVVTAVNMTMRARKAEGVRATADPPAGPETRR